MTPAKVTAIIRSLKNHPKFKQKLRDINVTITPNKYVKELEKERGKMPKELREELLNSLKEDTTQAHSYLNMKSIYMDPKKVKDKSEIRSVIAHEHLHAKNPFNLGAMETPAYFVDGLASTDNKIKGIIKGIKRATKHTFSKQQRESYGGVKGKAERLKKFLFDRKPWYEKEAASSDWVAAVLAGPDMLDLPQGMFTWADPKKIAKEMLKSVKASKVRKGTLKSSGISMMTYYINRAGKNLDPKRKETIMEAKEEYRQLVDKEMSKKADIKGPLFDKDSTFETNAPSNKYELKHKDKILARIYHKIKTDKPSGIYIEPNYDNKHDAVKLLLKMVSSNPSLLKSIKLKPTSTIKPTGLHKGLNRLGLIE